MLAALAFATAIAVAAPARPSVAVGQPFPAITLVDRDGGQHNVPDDDGKPVLFTFFASWCPPCRNEMPRIAASYERYHDRLAFYGVDLFEPDRKAAQMIKDLSIRFPVLTLSTTDRDFFGTGFPIPTSILIDGKGIVRDIWSGYDDAGPGPFFGHLGKVGIR